MIPRVLNREQVREVDRRAIEEFGLPGVVLMENAGRGCTDWLLERGVAGRVVICCGRGNNGGDGFVIARHLDNHGVDVRVLLFARPDDLRGDAAINFRVIERAGLAIRVLTEPADLPSLADEFRPAEWIVDGLLGTGTLGRLREPVATVIEAINQSPARVLAIDLPSGLDCDTGTPVDLERPAVVRAEATATFVARKPGFDVPEAAAFCGEVRVIDIGVPRALWT